MENTNKKPVQIINRHDTEENWQQYGQDIIPSQAELIVYDIDDNHKHERFKIGDGKTNVNDLPFFDVDSDKYVKVDSDIYIRNGNNESAITIGVKDKEDEIGSYLDIEKHRINLEADKEIALCAPYTIFLSNGNNKIIKIKDGQIVFGEDGARTIYSGGTNDEWLCIEGKGIETSSQAMKLKSGLITLESSVITLKGSSINLNANITIPSQYKIKDENGNEINFNSVAVFT